MKDTIDRLISEIRSPDAFDAKSWSEALNTLSPEDMITVFRGGYACTPDCALPADHETQIQEREALLKEQESFVSAMKRIDDWREERTAREKEEADRKAHDALAALVERKSRFK